MAVIRYTAYLAIGPMKGIYLRGIGRSARLGRGPADRAEVRDHAEHIKMGIDEYFYGGPGGKAPRSCQFFNKTLA